MVWDDTMEPTAADHGDVLYNIGKHPMIGRFMEARRDIHPGEVRHLATSQPTHSKDKCCLSRSFFGIFLAIQGLF